MVGKVECACDVLEEIEEFRSISEFERFQKYIDDLVSASDLTEVRVQKSYAGFPEQWYQCKECHQIWRLVHPDFPFKGLWDRVN